MIRKQELTKSAIIFSLPMSSASGLVWRWRSADHTKESEQSFGVYADCAADAKRNGYTSEIIAHPVSSSNDGATPYLLADVHRAQAVELIGVLKENIERCAHELSRVYSTIKGQMTSAVPGEATARALTQTAAVEVRLFECAEDLLALSAVMSGGVLDREVLERELWDSRADLLETRAELAHSQTSEKKARHIALHDEVTGLPNRSLFDDRLTHALVQAKRHAWRVAVMFVDLDKFKMINDSYGHAVGDTVLHAVAQRLRASVRSGDSVGRRGGDEFLCLMLEAKDDSSIEHLARKMIDNIAEPITVGERSLKIQASVGVAVYPEDAQSAQSLLKKADMAMYKAKQGDKGYLLFSSIREDSCG
jgi:diguanylate cyclase (GGDEF)-like protein